MVTYSKVLNEYERLLLDSSSTEISELYKNINTKFISTIGTVENNFNYDKEEQEKLKDIIQNINRTLKQKYYSSEIDITTKFNALLKEYLNLQSEYISKEFYSTFLFVLNIEQTVFSNLKHMEYILIDLGFNYYANSLPSNISFLNATIKLAVEEIEQNINLFNNLTLNVLDNPSIFYAELEPMKELIRSSLAKTESYINKYEKLKANPFEEVVKIELNTVEDVYSGKANFIEAEKEQILNNVPSYDFNNFELILPEEDIEGAVNNG